MGSYVVWSALPFILVKYAWVSIRESCESRKHEELGREGPDAADEWWTLPRHRGRIARNKESRVKKKHKKGISDSDAVQTLLARYLQRRLQSSSQISTPPPPSVIFSLAQQNQRSKSRQAAQTNNISPLHSLEEEDTDDRQRNERRERRYEYDDYEDDLEGFEDSDKSRTRINLLADDCPNCVEEHTGNLTPARWTMPLLKLGEKRYYLGIFFKANWYRASQYCRYHGMHLASISSQEENDRLEKHIKDFGLGHEHFWISGTDQAEEGTFFWMANGRPITFENWNVGEPNNFQYENGEEEDCLELWNRDGKGLKWNDSPCSFETFFVCEVQ
ncbi:low affinity immunoglobulin epsilon Fc receptor-like [Venturia canescens]|uniref:low affinity immunoglobulin epsilon Fc receptor-like n=1 Tax=Venturia canescens TaxID=32260 RepID=UPI001C9C080A|nr:low affinity immunoglobulin epsilon Fc receptor-like [Venturia canescens]